MRNKIRPALILSPIINPVHRSVRETVGGWAWDTVWGKVRWRLYFSWRDSVKWSCIKRVEG
jgi:hypothetical protein